MQEFGFCVSAEGADANCFFGAYAYEQNAYEAQPIAYSTILSDPKQYEGNGTDINSWKLVEDGRIWGMGLWSATFNIGSYSATPGESKPFNVDGFWFQPTESNSTKNTFRFSPGAVKLHAKAGDGTAQWASVDFTLTGAVSIAAGVAVAAASLLAF